VLQQALPAYNESWETFLRLPVSRTSDARSSQKMR